jgi:outer membrane immunogenic protein
MGYRNVFMMSRVGVLGAAVAGTVVLGSANPVNADGMQRGSQRVDAPFSWTGFYAGANAGAGYGQIDKAVTFTGDNPAPAGAGTFFLNGIFTDDPASGLNAFSQSLFSDGFVGGGQLGYNWQFTRKWVAGLEADIQSGLQGSASVTGNLDPVGFTLPVTLTANQDLKWFGTARGRLGFATERFLMFGTAGLAYGRTEVSANMTNPNGVAVGLVGSTTLVCPPSQVCIAGADSKTPIGWTVGGGLEWALWDHVMVKVEYLHVDLGDQTVRLVSSIPGNTGFITAKFDNSFDIVRAGLNYKF